MLTIFQRLLFIAGAAGLLALLGHNSMAAWLVFGGTVFALLLPARPARRGFRLPFMRRRRPRRTR